MNFPFRIAFSSFLCCISIFICFKVFFSLISLTHWSVVVQLLSHVWLFATLWTATWQSFLVLHYLLEFAQAHVHWVNDTSQPSHPVAPLCSVFPSIRVFSSELASHIWWPKYWSFSFSISLPMNIQGWCPLGLTDLISLLSKELSRVLSSTMVQKHQFFVSQPSLWLPVTSVGESNGNPLQYSCLENPRDRSLVGCRLWGCTELDTTDVT